MDFYVSRSLSTISDALCDFKGNYLQIKSVCCHSLSCLLKPMQLEMLTGALRQSGHGSLIETYFSRMWAVLLGCILREAYCNKRAGEGRDMVRRGERKTE